MANNTLPFYLPSCRPVASWEVIRACAAAKFGRFRKRTVADKTRAFCTCLMLFSNRRPTNAIAYWPTTLSATVVCKNTSHSHKICTQLHSLQLINKALPYWWWRWRANIISLLLEVVIRWTVRHQVNGLVIHQAAKNSIITYLMQKRYDTAIALDVLQMWQF